MCSFHHDCSISLCHVSLAGRPQHPAEPLLFPFVLNSFETVLKQCYLKANRVFVFSFILWNNSTSCTYGLLFFLGLSYKSWGLGQRTLRDMQKAEWTPNDSCYWAKPSCSDSSPTPLLTMNNFPGIFPCLMQMDFRPVHPTKLQAMISHHCRIVQENSPNTWIDCCYRNLEEGRI